LNGTILIYGAMHPMPTKHHLIVQRARMEGFIMLDYMSRSAEAISALAGWASPLRQRGLDWLPPAFASGRIWRHVKTTIINDPEKRLIEALKNVDAHGDVAPPHVHDPMTMVLRGTAIQAHLMHWDDARGRYALTGAGRRRISARGALLARSYPSGSARCWAAACSTGNRLAAILRNNPSGCRL
jgi:hypothetical protein